ncbi:MAG: PPOX class F420-dependent oxidoreductase [Acidimicrobiia bacterium]|nr:PPOX class F420-dependent oxidoreductase [Acidimicrobiia bacterium]MDH4306436.1 PPOX class F420-dependent oxidoreductase [Acidimicrobiia bacterium]MDH5292647.1 PPOX class F420-dependent oxidoreductase [Acidimicrobiia bacterium]
MAFKHASFLDVSAGLQPNQFTVGERSVVNSLSELPSEYRQLLDGQVTAVLAVIGGDGRPNLSPVWFGYSGDRVLLNFAEHRRKTSWIRANPQVTVMLMNPANPYHWLSIKATVAREIHEDGPDGHRATDTIDEMWTKYTGNEPPYGLRDPSFEERRVLFECEVDSVATFGRP